MVIFDCSFYITGNKITDFDGGTFDGVEKDSELETKLSQIIPEIARLLKGNPSINTKGFRWVDTSGKKPKAKNVKKVYFVRAYGLKWLDSGEFKGEPKFEISESAHNSYEFKKIGILSEKSDLKELARVDKPDISGSEIEEIEDEVELEEPEIEEPEIEIEDEED